MMKIVLLLMIVGQAFCRSDVHLSDDNIDEEIDKKVILPGTLWCGIGNISEDDKQLGRYADVDACCRSHDKCDRIVHAFSKKYGYRNWRPFTVSDCKCDLKLYHCLKSAQENPTAAKIVGKVFFNALRMPCLLFHENGTKATKGKSPSY